MVAVALAASVVTDLRHRRIRNVVTFPALLLVLFFAALEGGSAGVALSLAGSCACALPFLLASLRGWVGMGDVKLIAVVAAAAGWPLALAVLFWVSIAGGLQALVQMAAARLRRLPPPRHLPYACAIAAGSLAAFVWGQEPIR